MTGTRNPGRYNLHRLGWSAFEDLSIQVMKVVLGETCSRFRPGPDGGRDGWFQGVAAGGLVIQNGLSGSFVIQCKHSSKPQNPLDDSDLKAEISKVTTLAAKTPCHYILITNRQVSAQAERIIQAKFEAIPNVGRCLILSETWIEDTIDAHPRLLRMVPRLYGIGDLSQILSFSIAEQSQAVLDDLVAPLRTFVPTESYRRAERALHEHGFAVLVGPPASGKTAIAANLCMVSLAQEEGVRILKIEHADQFKETWSPHDQKTIYWVDDVFGETTLDGPLLREWSSALDKVEAARRRKARIIFCTRDYILADAEQQLKRSRADMINDARVRIEVRNLSNEERGAILYNHIKDGEISRGQKSALKIYLAELAKLPSFTPELARRLGSPRFHRGLHYTLPELRKFFDRPVNHFRDIIHGLSKAETAALTTCLYSGNAVPDPIPDGVIAEAVLRSFDVTVSQVRDAFESLNGSLVKRVRNSTKQTWQLHHPSMIEALQEELSSKSSKLMLYLQSADMGAVLRDTTTLPIEPNSRLVFIPESVYEYLVTRLHPKEGRNIYEVANYLGTRASGRLLEEVDKFSPELIDACLSIEPDPESTNYSINLAIKLEKENNDQLFNQRRREILKSALESGIQETGCSGFLGIEEIETIFPGFVDGYIKKQIKEGFPSLEKLYRWYSNDLSSESHVDIALDALESHVDRLRNLIERGECDYEPTYSSLILQKEKFETNLEDRRSELIEENDEEEEEFDFDSWRERKVEERFEREQGLFSDVDE